jgi:acyl carrier protein
VAYVVADADLRIAGLRARVREALPEAWWPAAFVCLPALPRLANGKLDRGALPLPAEEPAGAGQPVTAIEATLQSLWAELLRRDSVGVGDDFFALGGHSLLATRLIARLRDRLGVEVPLIRLFENPSIRDLAPVIANLLAQGAGPAAGEGVGPVIRRQSRQPGRAANP